MSEQQSKNKIWRAVAPLVVVLVGWLVIRGTIFPKTVVDDEVVIKPGQLMALGWEANMGSPRIRAEIESVNGVPLTLFFVQPGQVSENTPFDYESAKKWALGDDASSSAIQSIKSTLVLTGEDKWELIIVNVGSEDARVKREVLSYFRPF